MIQSITIPLGALDSYGLAAPETMRNLGNIVLLAGRNGAGKTRFLTLLHDLLQRVAEGGWPALNNDFLRQQQSLKSQIDSELRFKKTHDHLGLLREAGYIDAALNFDKYITVSDGGPRGCKPTKLEARMPAKERSNDTTSPADATEWITSTGKATPQPKEVVSNLDLVFGDLAQTLVTASATNVNLAPHQEKIDVTRRFVAQLAKQGFEVAASLAPDMRPTLTINGRTVSDSRLSDGQKLLVAWLFLLSRKGSRLDGSILLLDEPENSLHPAAAVEALTLLRDAVGPHGQLWIATHSVATIAAFGTESLYLLEDSKLTFGGGREVAKVVDGLLGGPDSRNNLALLLDAGDSLAMAQFAAQCLAGPTVAEHRSKDPQEAQLSGQLQPSHDQKPMRVLDYGCGKARLAQALGKAWSEAQLARLEYTGFDDELHKTDAAAPEAARRAIESLKLQGACALYKEDDLGFGKDQGVEFDRVVLCNVLHEIPATDWHTCFKKISTWLAPSGKVIIAEDLLPSVGELPHPRGYLIAGHAALRALCPGYEAPNDPDPRLLVAELDLSHLNAITQQTVAAAVRKIAETAKRGIQHVRQHGDHSFSDGRKHAHFAIQFANAALALEQLE